MITNRILVIAHIWEQTMTRRKNKLSLDERASLKLAEDNPHLEYIRLSRREICKREINSAIFLFIFNEDPISAHVLASAANEILSALSKGKAGVGLNDMRAFMKKNNVASVLQEELFSSLQHPYNFLKHSSSDTSVENDFPIEHIVMGMYTAVHGYKLLFDDTTIEMRVFYGMVAAWRLREWWPDDPQFSMKLDAARSLGLIDVDRKDFCAAGRRMIQLAWDSES